MNLIKRSTSDGQDHTSRAGSNFRFGPGNVLILATGERYIWLSDHAKKIYPPVFILVDTLYRLTECVLRIMRARA